MQFINLLKLTGYVMHKIGLTFNNCTLCPQCIDVFCIYLRTNSDLCHLHHKMIGFYKRDENCLLRCTDWVFKQSGLPFVFKSLNACWTEDPNTARKNLSQHTPVKIGNQRFEKSQEKAVIQDHI
jgi:hypothetical protein